MHDTATITTRIHSYYFHMDRPAEAQAYADLRARLTAEGIQCFKAIGKYYHPEFVGGFSIQLETAHLFDNQWNTAPILGVSDKGLRVFDWAEASRWGNDQKVTNIRDGHWIEQTEEMRTLRAETLTCGYCAKQVTKAGMADALGRGAIMTIGGARFCAQCIGGEYTTEKELPLLRLMPVNRGLWGGDRPELTIEERAELLPVFELAQRLGHTTRDKQRIAAARARLVKECEEKIATAKIYAEGHLWILDHAGHQLNSNAIYYDHTGRWAFGWMKPLEAAEVSRWLEVASEFPYPYDVICADGHTLSAER